MMSTFEEVNEIVFLGTPSKVAKVLKIDENFPTVKTTGRKRRLLVAAGQILEYTETYREIHIRLNHPKCDR